MELLGDFGRWFGEQPFSSKWLLLFSLSVPVLFQFKILPIAYIYYSAEHIFLRLQFWRMFTALFLTQPSIGWLFNCFFRFQYSSQLEFLFTRADYLFFLLLSALAINVRPFALMPRTVRPGMRIRSWDPCGVPTPCASHTSGPATFHQIRSPFSLGSASRYPSVDPLTCVYIRPCICRWSCWSWTWSWGAIPWEAFWGS